LLIKLIVTLIVTPPSVVAVKSSRSNLFPGFLESIVSFIVPANIANPIPANVALVLSCVFSKT
tara:strand:+ start:267 stop:455 length:189 start_codon:yes stop_codon:yes gene_type:complete